MRQAQILFVFLFASVSFGQDDRYRMDVGLSLHSKRFWDQKIEHVLAPGIDHIPVYKTEYYDLTYDYNGMSLGFNFSISFNWINQEHFILKQRHNLAIEIYTDRVTFTLSDIGDGSTIDSSHFSTNEVPLGYTNSATFNGIVGINRNEILGLWVSDNDFQIGGGVSHNYWAVVDDPKFTDGYVPWGFPRGWGAYWTHQLGVSAHFEKKFDWWSVFINLNQTFLTLKKEKGSVMFRTKNELEPVSHNIDFRFPLTFQFGAAINFWKIKK